MQKPDYNDINYDYTKYWDGRTYENASELIALEKLLPDNGERILDAGGGFGRLIPSYKDRFKEIVVLDQSTKILSQAVEKANELNVNINTVVGDVTKLSSLSIGTFDCVVMVRVAHHLDNLNEAIKEVYKVLNPGGIFILEFANKLHFKSVIKNTISLNFKYFNKNPVSRATKDVMFYNFHPSFVNSLLKDGGFKTSETLSVSNFRLPILKKHISESSISKLEKLVQKPLASLYFGPSIFIKSEKLPV